MESPDYVYGLTESKIPSYRLLSVFVNFFVTIVQTEDNNMF